MTRLCTVLACALCAPALAAAAAAADAGLAAALKSGKDGKPPAFSHAGVFDVDGWFAHREARMADASRLRDAYARCVAALRNPAENVTVPVENYEDGSVKTVVHAERAQFFVDDAFVWGEGIEVKHFSALGDVVARLTAESCVIDRRAKCGWAEGRARVVYGGTSVEGDGIFFSIEDEYIIICAKTRIETKDLDFGGLKL